MSKSVHVGVHHSKVGVGLSHAKYTKVAILHAVVILHAISHAVVIHNYPPQNWGLFQ